MTTATSGRVYGGLTAEERAAQRRSRLLAAGLEVFGTVGYAGATQRAVLQQAGLGERYFEESFADL
ncbi:MAG TPA: TetR family transcriptional regulator, partial [Mycobacteriales bacterium]|nr:TetR family transcriptional regulator [Mycobacteriales bacterium]